MDEHQNTLKYCGLDFNPMEILEVINRQIDLVKEPVSEEEKKALKIVGFACFLEGTRIGAKKMREIIDGLIEKVKPEMEEIERFRDLILRLTPIKGRS
jgi:hypothetical protein